MLMTGIFGLVFSPRVPPISSPSSLLATIIATAPRSAATACFTENWQVPRSTSTIGSLDGQAVVVRRRTARRILDAGGDQRPGDAVVGRADGELQRLGRDRRAADRELGFVGERQAHLELGRLHVEALVTQCLRDVVDACVVAGGAQRAVAVVGVGDLLQLRQVAHHRVDGDPPACSVAADIRSRRPTPRVRRAGWRLAFAGLPPQPPSAAAMTTVMSTADTARDVRPIVPTLAGACRRWSCVAPVDGDQRRDEHRRRHGREVHDRPQFAPRHGVGRVEPLHVDEA